MCDTLSTTNSSIYKDYLSILICDQLTGTPVVFTEEDEGRFSWRINRRQIDKSTPPHTYFFLNLGDGGGGADRGGGTGGAGGVEWPLFPSFRGRPRGLLSGAGLMVAVTLARWALRPARVMGGAGPLSWGSWASEGILGNKKKIHSSTPRILHSSSTRGQCKQKKHSACTVLK